MELDLGGQGERHYSGLTRPGSCGSVFRLRAHMTNVFVLAIGYVRMEYLEKTRPKGRLC